MSTLTAAKVLCISWLVLVLGGMEEVNGQKPVTDPANRVASALNPVDDSDASGSNSAEPEGNGDPKLTEKTVNIVPESVPENNSRCEASVTTNTQSSPNVSSCSSATSDYKPVDTELIKNEISQLFDGTGKLHNRETCNESSCCALSAEESKRMSGQKDRFIHGWLSDRKLGFCSKTGYWWLTYVEGQGMYCLLCKKHNCINPQNKCSSFAEQPSVRMKKSALYDHINSKKHQGAIETEMLNRISVFQKEVSERSQVKHDVLYKVFYAIFWLAKESIANEKVLSLLKLIETLGVEELRHFQHKSRGSLREILLVLGDQIQDEIVSKLKKASCFSVMLDDTSDVSSTEQMICFVQYLDKEICETKYLFIENVLAKAASATAENLYNLFNNKMVEMEIDLSKLSGISTDGASVMVGKRDGFVAKLKRDCPSLVAIHCICHRLALACIDTNKDLHYIKEVESYACQVWKMFHYSPVKLASLLKIQTELNKLVLSENSRTMLTRTMKRACQTRWLSFNEAIQSLHRELVAVVQALNLFEKDATAFGLMKKLTTLKFVGTMYILQQVLPILADLSRHFQKGKINFSMIEPALLQAKVKLQSLLPGDHIIDTLVQDLSPCGRFSTLDINVSDSVLDQLKRFLSKYIDALCHNIESRFPQTPLLSSFTIFDPMCLPEKNHVNFATYGVSNVSVLADHFFPDSETAKDQITAEWSNIKFHLTVWKKDMPDEVREGSSDETPTSWMLKKMLLQKSALVEFFPLLMKVVEVIVTLPVSNAWPERGFSKLKIVKTRIRSRMQNDILQSLLTINLNAPSLYSTAADHLIRSAVQTWLAMKPRRKLPKVAQGKKSDTMNVTATTISTESAVELTETSTQTDLQSSTQTDLGQTDDVDYEVVQREYDNAALILKLAKHAAEKLINTTAYDDDDYYDYDDDDYDDEYENCCV